MSKPLDDVFPPEQATALTAALEQIHADTATRAELEEVRGLLERILDRLDAIAPEDEVPEEHLAIMSAVFTAYMGKKVRVRTARVLPTQPSWSQAGRASLHAQRNVRRG